LQATLALGCVGAPLFLRAQMLLEKCLALSSVDVRGALLDIAVGLCLLMVCRLLVPFSRIGSSLIVASWVLIDCVSWEHVRVLNSLSLLHNVHYLLDPIFLKGSVLHPSWPTTIAVLAAIPSIVACWAPAMARPSKPTLVATGCACSLVVAALLAFGSDSSQLAWRRENVVVRNVSEIVQSAIAHQRRAPPSLPDVRRVFAADLSGRSRYVARAGELPNVLIILIEGLSGAYVPSIARYHGVTSSIQTPRLDALSGHGLTFTNVLAQQRQTNRGEYAVFCGDYPKLRSETSHMTRMALGQRNRVCLPQILRDAGYVTSYLQAAPMPFMLKDKFMARAGFSEQHGTEFFQSAYKRNSWGVDDRTFFEQSARHVRSLVAEHKPWLLSLLTVGTHHPFLVPPGCQGPGSAYAQAVGCADLAVSEFVETLGKEGILDNTLVLITADESDGLQEGDDFSQQLSQNWIPLLVLLPHGDGAGQVNHSLVLQSDFALSILDYLGRTDRGSHLVGRSLFREYSQARTAYFANTYLNRVWMLEPEYLRPRGHLSGCTEALRDCASYTVNYERLFNPRRTRTTTLAQSMPTWQAVIEHTTDSTADRDRINSWTRPLLLRNHLVLEASDSAQVVFGGQYVSVPRHSRVDLELDFQIDGPPGGQALLSVELRDRERSYWSPPIPRVNAGDRVRIRADYLLAEPVSALEATMHAQVVGAAALEAKFSTNTLAVTRHEGITRSALERESVQVSRAAMPETLTYRLGDHSLFEHVPCFVGLSTPVRLEGSKCRGSGYFVYGPHAWVPAGVRLRARFDVALSRGVAKLHGEISANGGTLALSSGEKITTKAGDRVVLEAYYAADDELTDVEARLGVEQVSAIADYVVAEASLELVR
jgi:phosphoglycerol transferase MdoB-like AlkP superfamily enzyme